MPTRRDRPSSSLPEDAAACAHDERELRAMAAFQLRSTARRIAKLVDASACPDLRRELFAIRNRVLEDEKRLRAEHLVAVAGSNRRVRRTA